MCGPSVSGSSEFNPTLVTDIFCHLLLHTPFFFFFQNSRCGWCEGVPAGGGETAELPFIEMILLLPAPRLARAHRLSVPEKISVMNVE